jgi:hypothetical protein
MDVFEYTFVLVSIVVGLGLARLLNGFARIIHEPLAFKVYSVHLLWAVYTFVYLIWFWWFEYRFIEVQEWNFLLYLFIVLYSVLLYVICAILFPPNLDNYDGFEGYFHSRKKWIFGLWILLYLVDIGDTAFKGEDYIERLGLEYILRICVFFGLSIVAMFTDNRIFHTLLVTGISIYQYQTIIFLYWSAL